MRRILTVISLAGAIFFVLCAYWQFNDPDALRWIFVYATAALAGLAVIFKWLSWQVPVLLALIAMGFSLYYVWVVTSQSLHFFEDEAGREMMGSILVCLYMAILGIHARMNQNSSFFS